MRLSKGIWRRRRRPGPATSPEDLGRGRGRGGAGGRRVWGGRECFPWRSNRKPVLTLPFRTSPHCVDAVRRTQVASIFSFATCGGFKGKTSFKVSCPSENVPVNGTVEAAFAYPFRLNQISLHALQEPLCNINWSTYFLIGDFSSSAQFYVTFAALVFLYCIAALVLYIGYMNLYRESRKIPFIDFLITLIAAFLWLVSTSAWAKALTDIKMTTGENLIGQIDSCESKQIKCSFDSVTSMGSLNVSVIFGFLNMILWGGNAWFVYKETSLHGQSNVSTHGAGTVAPPTGM